MQQVSCIHYVPFPKLGALEVRRRTQKINPRSRRGDMPGEAPRDDIPLWTEQLWEVDEDKVSRSFISCSCFSTLNVALLECIRDAVLSGS